MVVGWGVDAILNGDGSVDSGTSSNDVQRVWGALYSPGVITGCIITPSKTSMAYVVGAGAVAIEVVDKPRQCVMVPIDTSTISVSPTGDASRVDTIYVQQDLPGVSNIATVRVAQGVNPPADVPTQIIARYTVPANSTTATGAVRQSSVLYSVPYGANLGHFFSAFDSSNSLLPTTPTTMASGSFSLALDRKILFTLDACLSAVRPSGSAAVGFDNSAYCEAKYDVYLNGIKAWTWNSPGLSQAWGTYNFSEYRNLTQGTYTVSYRAYTLGAGKADRHYAGTNGATGTSFNVRDSGFWEPIDEAV